MADFEINGDFERVSKALSGTTKSITSIQKGILSIIGRGTRSEIKKITKSIKGNGLIAGRYPYSISSAFTYKVKADGSKVSVFPKKIEKNRPNDLTIPVISTLNYGKNISVRNGRKYLVFQTADGWKKCKSVRIPGHHFIEAGKQYAGSAKYMNEVEKYVQKELDKYWR